MQLVQWNTEELNALSSFSGMAVPQTNPALFDTKVHDVSPTFLETAYANFQRENMTLEVLSAMYRGVKDRVEAGESWDEIDPSWNPYRYIRENWEPERQEYFLREIRAGLFEQAKNAAQLEARAASLEREKKLLETIEGGSALGAITGALGAAFTDISTYTPLGFINRLRTVGRIGKGVIFGATGAAIPEVGLHAVQDLRTAQESFLNIGVGAALGGGLGAFSRVLHPEHPLNPKNPDNPLRPENMTKQGVGVRVPGEEQMDVIGAGDLSAAESPFRVSKALPGLTNKLGIGWLGDRFSGVTPAGRALQWTGERSRFLLTKMMDLGGILTDTARYGVRIGPSAEDIKRDLLVERDILFGYGDRLLRELNRELGQSAVPNALGIRGTVNEVDFAEISRKKLLQEWNETDRLALVREYGAEAAPKIEAKAEAFANKIHETNAKFERELIELGHLRDPAKVESLRTQIASLTRQIDSEAAQIEGAKQEIRAKIKDLKAEAKANPDRAEAIKQSIRSEEAKLEELRPDPALREERRRLRDQLAAEMRKPEPMGKEYGHAQLWDPHTIMSKQEEFEDFLLEVLVDRPDEQWLTDAWGITPDVWARLGVEDVEITVRTPEGTDEVRKLSPEEGAEYRSKILREWAGDEHVYNINRAELRAEAAEQALKQAELDLTEMIRTQRWVKGTVGRLTLSQARKTRDAFHERLEAARARREQLRAEQAALREAATAARTITLERKLQPEALTEATVRKLDSAVESAEKDLFVTISDSLKDPATKGRLTNSGEYVRAVERLSQAIARRDQALSGSRNPEVTVRLARAQERANARARELQKIDSRVRRMEQSLARVDSRLAEVTERLEIAKRAKAAVDDAVAEARRAKRIAEKDLRKVKRALVRSQKVTPLAQMVADIRSSLMNRNELPHAVLDNIIPETGRVKARRIRLTPEQRRRAEEMGLLRTDLPGILASQYDQLSGHIGLHVGMDIREGGRFQSWSDVLRSVDEEYDELTRNVRGKQQAKLNAEREKIKKDLNLLKDRLLGMENIGVDRDGWAYWLSAKARQANFIRFGAGFLLPSLTDIASVHLRTGSLAKLLKKHGREAVRAMMEMPESELRAMVNATELGASPRMANAFDAEDANNLMGIGPRGTVKHTVTSRIDRGMKWLSDKTNLVSGMRAWNRFWKITAGIQRAYKLRDVALRWDSLSDLERAEWASLGIDQEAANRIRKMVEKFGETDANGHWDPNLDLWTDTAEGRAAARDFRIAVERDMNRAIFTPGIGDTPGIMSHAAGKLWLQFQTYAFTFLNRFLTPASQRIASFRDAQALVSFAHLAWAGLIVVVGKDLLRGEDPMKRFEQDEWARTVQEVIDRSGMLAYMSPYVDSLLKVSGPIQEDLFGDVVIGPTSRFARNNWLESLGGASFGLYRDIQSFGIALAERDREKILKKGLLLMPYNTYFRIAQQLAE